MNKSIDKKTAAIVLLLLFGLLIAAVKTIDVQPIGPENSCIGLAALNSAAHRLFGVNLLWYGITDWIGLLAIATAFGFAVLGACQLLHRKSFKKVDADIYLLGGFYIAVIAFYVLFELCIVNYRPILLNGALEASFPSSHTMIVVCIMATAIMQLNERIKKPALKKAACGACAFIIAITVVGRLVSGVHWLTDIIGGLLLSGALVLLYSAARDALKGDAAPKQ